MTQPIIDVLLVDNHTFFRSILLRLLEDIPHIHVVAIAKNGYEALDICHLLHPTVVLMDLNMEMMDGLAATTTIRQQYPNTNILILTGTEDHTQAIATFKAGAAGYLRKDSITPQNLITAIQCVAEGGIYIDPHVFSVLLLTWHAAELPPEPHPLLFTLTPDDRNLLRQIALGKNNQEIAYKEAVSSKTVANKASILFKKIEVNSRVQAVHFALRHGLVHLDETAV